MAKFTILGAGMAGLFAAQMLQRTGHDVDVWEAQHELPNNHSAVLRFRTDAVGRALGIPFKSVRMIKATESYDGPVADAMHYSRKATGVSRTDRSLPTEPVSAERFIAPPDLIAQMAEGLNIYYGHRFRGPDLFELSVDDRIVISTIPMPVMAMVMDYPDVTGLTDQCKSRELVNVTATVADCDAYASVYIPDPRSAALRASITGDWLTIECRSTPSTDDTLDGLRALGIDRARLSNVETKLQKYGKVLPLDEHARRRFLFWLTDTHGVFSLGRFATWRPGLLMDDLVNDIAMIARWTNDKYSMSASRAKG